jgi:hypothetical protein
MVPIKKAHNYILRAKAMELMEPKVKGEPVAHNKANKADLPLNVGVDEGSIPRPPNWRSICK